MGATWTKTQRQRAKSERKHLICLAVDGRDVGKGMMEYTAIVDDETARRVDVLINELIQEQTQKRKES